MLWLMLILVGLVNPYSGEALAPSPPNSAGRRLWKMSGLSREDYLAIRRTNLFVGQAGKIDRFVLDLAGGSLRRCFSAGDVVVALGDEVRRAFGLPRQLILPIVRDGVTYRQVPHPSGRCLFYNDPANRKLVELLFRCLLKS